MDPRMFTVKQCAPAYASKSGAGIGNATSQRRDFFNSVGKIGDLNVLNSVGGGKIGQGLRNLASISNSIRTGCGSLPTTIGSSIEAGANWVLSQTGIAPTVVDALRGFSPGIANQAYGQAKVVYDQVKNGKFKAKDIPGFLQDFQNLERLGRNIFTPNSGDVSNSLSDRCEASPYAVDLIARFPKYKFLFVIQFVAESGYEGLGSSLLGPLDMAFVVKRSTRPNIKFTDESVNYYNFRTSVITKTEFEPMTMSFHDDTTNSAMKFYKSYLRAMSPITGIEGEGAQPDLLEQGGMNFHESMNIESRNTSMNRVMAPGQIEGTIPAGTYAASHGVLANDRKQVFKEVRIYHLYDSGNKMNVFRFFNPRINSLNLDDVDMAGGSEGNELAMTFNYDYVYLDTDVSVRDDLKYKIGDTQRGAVYPIRYNDGATTSGPNNAGINPYGVPVQAATNCDPLSPIKNASATISNAGSKAVSALGSLGSKFSNPGEWVSQG